MWSYTRIHFVVGKWIFHFTLCIKTIFLSVCFKRSHSYVAIQSCFQVDPTIDLYNSVVANDRVVVSQEGNMWELCVVLRVVDKLTTSGEISFINIRF